MKLFDREENYLGKIKYVLAATHSEEINGEDVLEFTTLDKRVEKGYRIIYKDIFGYWREFVVRGIEEEKKDDGIIKYVYCESSFYETLGDYIEDKRPSGHVSIALNSALESTRWEIGIVDDLGTNSTNFYRTNVKESVEKIAEIWKGEIRTRVEVAGNKITKRYVDILSRRGNDLGKRFTYTKDIEEIRKVIHRNDVITALYGYGKGEELESGGYGRRIDFSDINGGKAYVENLDALAIWGRNNPDGTKAHVFGKKEFDDVEDKEELLILTQEKLEEVSSPLVTYEAKVIDLKAFGFEHEGVELGDTVTVIDKDFKPELRLKARVVAIKRDILEPANNEIILGNFIPSIIDSTLENEEFINNWRSRQGIWDRSNVINDDGSISSNILNDLVDELNMRLNSQGGHVYISEEGKGIITYDKPIDQNPTKAIQILGGAFRIANSKLPNGEWNWRTFGTGDGFVADLITTGSLSATLIKTGVIQNEDGSVWWNVESGYINIDDKIIYNEDGIKINLSNGKSIEETIDEIELTPGPQGDSSYLWIRYSVNPNGDPMTTDSEGATYIGQAITTVPIAPSNFNSYSWSKIRGEDGEKGTSSYTHIRYSINSNGNPMVTTPNVDTKYIGIAVTDNEVAPVEYSSYNWSKYIGDNGISIDSVDVMYYLSTSNLTVTGGSWQTTPPVWIDGRYMWSKTVTTYSDSQISETEPVCITGGKGPSGDKGKGIVSITEEYAINDDKTTAPTTGWTENQPTWEYGFYIWTRSKIVYENPTSTEYTTPVVSSEWEAVNELADEINETIDNVVGRVTETETSITILTDGVNERITKEVYDEYVNGTTQKIEDLESNWERTSEEWDLNFRMTIGNNRIRNSLGFAGTEFWNANENDVWSVQNEELEAMGFGSGLEILTSTISQDVSTIDGDEYTLSMYVKATDSYASNFKFTVKIIGESGTIIQQSYQDPYQNMMDEYEQYTYTFSAESAITTVEIATELGSVLVTGIMLNEGNIPHLWSPYPREIYDMGFKFDKNGFRVSQYEDGREVGGTQITSDGLYNYYEGAETFATNKDEFRMKKGRIKETLDIGDARFIPMGNKKIGLMEIVGGDG